MIAHNINKPYETYTFGIIFPFLSLDQENERYYVKHIIPISQKGEEEEKHSITSIFFFSGQESPNQQ